MDELPPYRDDFLNVEDSKDVLRYISEHLHHDNILRIEKNNYIIDTFGFEIRCQIKGQKIRFGHFPRMNQNFTVEKLDEKGVRNIIRYYDNLIDKVIFPPLP